MASFLQKSNPWIENTFTFAISFNPDTEEGFGNNRTPLKNNNNNDDGEDGEEESDIFNSQYYNQTESQYVQTENTIPEGLVGTPEKQKGVGGLVGGREEDELSGITKDVIEAPSRQSKIAQVISRGGNFNYYNTSNNTNNNNEELNNKKKKTSSNNEENNCPPYLIIHDGEYSTIAFLSPEVCAEYNNNNGNGNNIPPNKSLISITHYTVSTIYQCCTSSSSSTETTTTNSSTNNNNNTTHLQIIKNLQTNPRTIPKPYSQQIQNQIQNPKLYTCLYIQSSIIIIGAENQGLINNPIDVHCSVLLRRCLIAHEMQNGSVGSGTSTEEGGGNANEEDLEEKEEREEHSHNVLITRLEAVHLHYQDLAEKKFHDEQHELNQLQHNPVQQQQEQQGRGSGLAAPDSPSSPTTSSLASNSPATSPHNNHNHTKKTKKKQYGRRRRNNKKNKQQQVGKKDSPYKTVGVSVVIPPEWPWLSRLVEQEQEGGKEEVGNNCLIKEEPVDENEMQRRMNMNSSSNGQQEEQEEQVNGELQSVPEEEEKEEEEEEENDKVIEEGEDNTKETDTAAPLEKKDEESSNKPSAARSIGNVIELFDNFDDIEEVLDLTELDDDDDDNAAAMDGTNQHGVGKSVGPKTADKKASIGMPKDDNERDGTTGPSRGNNTVSFVGIDDMLVDDDDDESEEDDNQLFTQPPDYVEEEEGGGFSQIPMALKRGSPKARFKKMNQNNEQQIVESQVPLPLTRKVASEKSPRRKHSLDEEDEDEFPQSQIPLPIRRASKKSVPPSEPNDDEDDDGILYQESQIPLPMKKKKKKASPLPTKKSKRWRKNMQEEETVPRSLRKQPPETLNVSGNDRRQSQIPLPTRKRVSNEGQVAAEEEDDRRQSQIPLPTRKKKKTNGHGKGQANRFSLQSNHYKSSRQHTKYSESEEDEDDDADGRIEMSQVPINTKKQSTRRKSPLKPKPKVDDYSSDASSDGWMQIRRTAKPKIKSKKSRSSLQSNHFGRKFDDSLERVGQVKSNRSKAQPPAKRTKYEDSDDSADEESQSQMAAGEGSEESLPPRKRSRGDDEVLGSKNDPTVQNSTVASKANAILGTSPPISSRTKQSNDDGLSLEGFKIVKNKKRKGNFDMSSFLENTKKFAWL